MNRIIGPQASQSTTSAGTNPALEVKWLTVDEESAGQRLDNFLIRHLKGVPKTHVYRIIRSGEVRVNKGRAAADTRIETGDVVRLPPVRISDKVAEKAARPAPGREFPLLLEDDALMAIDKPAGVAVHGGSGVSFGVIEQLRQARPLAKLLELVHRLDRETSGLMVFAKTPESKEILQSRWDDAEKRYEAVVEGRLREPRGIFESDLDETNPFKVFSVARSENTRHAVTHFRVLATTAHRSLVELTLETGRRHQIRVQLSDAGCPIIGDKKYGAVSNPAKRLGLHSSALRFPHPVSGKDMVFTCPLPKELARLV